MARLAGLLLVICAVAGAPGAAAQGGTARVRIMPSAGWYAPIQDARLVGSGTGAAWTRVMPGPAAGLVAEWAPAAAGVTLRGGLRFVKSDLAVRRHVGDSSCGENCYRSEYHNERVAGTSLLLATADMVVQGPRLWRVEPYFLLGGGVKRYGIRQQDLSGDVAAAYPKDEVDPTGHLGLGTALRLGRYALVAEAGDYVSTFDPGPSPDPALSRRIRGSLQHDLALSLGLRIDAR